MIKPDLSMSFWAFYAWYLKTRIKALHGYKLEKPKSYIEEAFMFGLHWIRKNGLSELLKALLYLHFQVNSKPSPFITWTSPTLWEYYNTKKIIKPYQPTAPIGQWAANITFIFFFFGSGSWRVEAREGRRTQVQASGSFIINFSATNSPENISYPYLFFIDFALLITCWIVNLFCNCLRNWIVYDIVWSLDDC